MEETRTLTLTVVVVLSCVASVSTAPDHLAFFDCMSNKSEETGSITELTVTPYPLHIPGNVTMSGTIVLRKPVSGHIRVDLTITKKHGGLFGLDIRLPCIANVGSCVYNDVCAMLIGEEPFVPTTTPTTTTTPVLTSTQRATSETPVTQRASTVSEGSVKTQSFTSSIPVTTSKSETSQPTAMSTSFTTSISKSETSKPTAMSTSFTTSISKSETSKPTAMSTSFTRSISKSETSKPVVSKEPVSMLASDAGTTQGIASDAGTTQGIAVDIATSHSDHEDTTSSTLSDTDDQPVDVTNVAVHDASTTTGKSSRTSDKPATMATSESVTSTQQTFTPSTEEPRSSTDQSVTMATSNPSSNKQPVSVATQDAVSTTEEPCPDVLVRNNLPCRCPFAAGVYHLPPTDFHIPDIGSLKSLATGDYTVFATFRDMDTGEMLACQTADVNIAGDVGPTECHGLRCLIG